MKRLILLVLLFFGFIQNTHAQQNFIIKVNSLLNKKGIDSVLVKNLNAHTESMTNVLGYAKIQLNSGDTLSFYHEKYQELSFIINDPGNISVNLKLKKEFYPIVGELSAFYRDLAQSLKARFSEESTEVILFDIDSTGKMVNIRNLGNECRVNCKITLKAISKLSKKWEWSPDYANSTIGIPFFFNTSNDRIKIEDDIFLLDKVSINTHRKTFKSN